MKKLLFISIILLVLLSGCADVSNVNECLPEVEHTYGFWGGLWHGMTIPLSFFGSLFSDEIAIYAVNNNGGWYDFGFWMGVGGLSAGIGRSSKK
ncbi:MAG: hypothetical protein SLAVMIC_00110 [uncultured marine phage]|uniref:Lipoprotein n=1 Tax=uncultured marine phage TaxID=707152 RepID=A0A8D9C8C4_9VIRU|nr:MAG: hypothetical protein SLAVMIC_00110 [uncultured marine phage]